MNWGQRSSWHLNCRMNVLEKSIPGEHLICRLPLLEAGENEGKMLRIIANNTVRLQRNASESRGVLIGENRLFHSCAPCALEHVVAVPHVLP